MKKMYLDMHGNVQLNKAPGFISFA
ncbi:hypothetical protein LCGC14_1515350, partial [marine sediment metagenome]